MSPTGGAPVEGLVHRLAGRQGIATSPLRSRRLCAVLMLRDFTAVIAVTNRRFIFKTGLIGRRVNEVSFPKLEGVLLPMMSLAVLG